VFERLTKPDDEHPADEGDGQVEKAIVNVAAAFVARNAF
jgi:hypothetical protein